MEKKLMFSCKNLNWNTPQSFYDKLDEEFHFTLDAAATDKSAKCRLYFTPDDDALTQNWGTAGKGGAVWCNPPYGRNIGLWVKKAKKESALHHIVVVMLIPARTDTRYFQDDILYGGASEVRFVRGRLHFTDDDGASVGPAPFPSAVIVFRPSEDRMTISYKYQD